MRLDPFDNGFFLLRSNALEHARFFLWIANNDRAVYSFIIRELEGLDDIGIAFDHCSEANITAAKTQSGCSDQLSALASVLEQTALNGGRWRKWLTGEACRWQTERAAADPLIRNRIAECCGHYTFSDPEVIRLSHSFIRLKADLTRSEDSSVKNLRQKFGIVGVPTIVFIDPKGEEIKGLRVTGFIEAEEFLERMKSVVLE